MGEVKKEVLDELNRLKAFVKSDYIITSGFRAGDSGEHGRGLAVDVVFPSYPGSLLDLYLAAERFQFKGIGVYPDWKVNGSIRGGLHLDMRTETPARWMGAKNPKTGKNEYFALDQANLKRLGVI